MKALTYDVCIKIYESRVNAGSLRDPHLLKSAVEAPYATYEGVNLFPSVIQKAARLAYGIAEAQAFTDGNKRLAWLCMITLLSNHGLTLKVSQEMGHKLLIQVAKREISLERFSELLNCHVE